MKGLDCGRIFLKTACMAGLILWGTTAAAQNNKIKKEYKAEEFSVKERIAIRTNMVDWVLTTPNIGVQYDVSAWDYNKWTVGANIRWNPGTTQTFTPNMDYRLLDLKLETRKYFRNKRVVEGKTPKFWRAYYWGVYAGYTDYTVFMKKGLDGECAGLGATAGWEVQLHKFKNGAIDLDMGLSAGWIYGRYDKRAEDGNGGYMIKETKDWHITPFPIISEVRIALVYRFKSVSEKYNKSKQ